KEPARRVVKETSISLRPIWGELVKNRGFLLLIYLGSACTMVHTYAQISWFPGYLIRVHGFTVAQVALYFAPLLMVVATVGALVSDFMYGRFGLRAPLLTLIGAAMGALLQGLSPLAPTAIAALTVFGVGYAFFAATVPLAPMIIQMTVAQDLRGRMSGAWMS